MPHVSPLKGPSRSLEFKEKKMEVEEMLRSRARARLTPRNDHPPTLQSFVSGSVSGQGLRKLRRDMPRCEFDTPQVVSEDASAVLAKLPPRLKHIIIGTGLHGVSALDPKDEFILQLVSDLGVMTEEDFLYVDPEFVEAAAASASRHPPIAKVQAFISSMSLSWRNGGAQLAEDSKQLCGRFMRAYKDVYKYKDTPDGTNPEGEDMDTRTENNLSAQFKAMYGQDVVVGELASSAICNSINKQFATGFIVDDMKSMVPRSEPRRGKEMLAFDLRSGMGKAVNTTSKGIGSVEDFHLRVHTYCYSLIYVSCGHVAPTDDWDGKACHGVVRDVRYQFSRTGAEFYEKFWLRHMNKFRSHVNELVRLESAMRSAWVNKYGTEKMSLECAMRESMSENARDTISWSPKRDRDWEEPPESPWRGGAGKGKGNDNGGKGKGKGDVKGKGRDISQLPGFRVGVRPFRGSVDGKEFCMPYNRGQQCWFAANCSKWHRCNAMKPDGSACNSTDHSFQEHPVD